MRYRLIVFLGLEREFRWMVDRVNRFFNDKTPRGSGGS